MHYIFVFLSAFNTYIVYRGMIHLMIHEFGKDFEERGRGLTDPIS
jgi:hypothetical protein